MKIVKTLFFFLISLKLFAGVGDLLPKPQNVKTNSEFFKIGKIQINSPVLKEDFSKLISELGGQSVEKSNFILQVNLVSDLPWAEINKNEAYKLVVEKQKIQIEALSEQGVYWAMQTLRQLKVEKKQGVFLEGCSIEDYPAFRIRGFMHDAGRTYISVPELKKQIKLLSQYKINVFHWHLTENQGWRLESKIHPELNAPENYQRMAGKFYTQEEAKDLVAFSKKHNVMLIPEIDMPGHSQAFVKATGYDMQTPEGSKILKEVIDEALAVFDVPYFHIGTDEVDFKNPNFVPEMVAHIRNKGKKVISWNPGWEYQPGQIDMLQLWSYRGKSKPGIPAIDCRLHYINHYDAFADVVGLYNSRILNVEKGNDDNAGSIICLWNDRFISDEKALLLQNNFYPSILALAERSWLGGGTEYFNKYGAVLPPKNTQEFKNFADFERRMLFHKQTTFKNEPFAYVKQTHQQWIITDPFPNQGKLDAVFPVEEKIADTYWFQGKEYKTRKVSGAGIYLRHFWGKIIASVFENAPENHTAYAYTKVYSPKKQKVGLWFASQNYSRSEKDVPPPQGKWDYKESRIWLNNSEILPPVWKSTHTELSNEIELTNENFEVRPPLQVTLKKGWNKVLIKLPIGKFSTKETRLSKWHFVCSFVTLNGEKAIENLIFE